MHQVRSQIRRRVRRYSCLVGGSVLATSLFTASGVLSADRESAARPMSATVVPWLGLEFSAIDAPPIRVASKPTVVIDLNVPRPMPLTPPATRTQRKNAADEENATLSSLPSIDARHASQRPSSRAEDRDAMIEQEDLALERPSEAEAEFPHFQSPQNESPSLDEEFAVSEEASELANRLPDPSELVDRMAADASEPQEAPSFEPPSNSRDQRRDDFEQAPMDDNPVQDEGPSAEQQSLAQQPPPDASILPEEEEQSISKDLHVAASVAEQGRGHIQRAIGLASRGAMYSSRAEFIKALRLVAHALDAETGTTRHSEALAAGLTALDEATAFQPRGSELPADMQLSQVIAAHQTPILKGVKPPATSLAAIQAYHGYAERQLALAGGHELTAADALFGLAKLQPSLRPSDSNWSARQGPLSMTYYQAALLVYPKHYMAANELGVMFARYGQLRDAKEVLQHAASTNPDLPEVWYNLAQVHQRLGETKMAQLAQREWESRSSKSKTAAKKSDGVAWVDSQTFQSGSDSLAGDGLASAPPRAGEPSGADMGEAVRVAERIDALDAAKKRRSFWPF